MGKQGANMQKIMILGVGFLLSLPIQSSEIEMWRGLVVKPESRCTPYDKSTQYPYSQSIEDTVVAEMDGKVYGPYTGTHFNSDRETDIEHIVATSEGHDSGLCAASAAVRKQFASDPLNLTLAAPKINRCGPGGKCGLDAGEWMPKVNKCWFANRIVQIKTKYGLSVDKREANTLEAVLSLCDSTKMVVYPSSFAVMPSDNIRSQKNALALYDSDKNGKISCAEARKHKIAPVRRDHIAYPYMFDRDEDGVVCE